VFLHGGFAGGSTLGERSIHNQVFYNRLGQRVIHILTSVTRFGSLYELDLRLRPDGNSGPLVVSVSGYQRYLQESAWVWELQALVRARFVAGSSRLEDQFDLVRRQVLAGVRDVELLRQEVLKMRDKMRGHLDSPTQSDEVEEILISGFDLKQSVGAIVDIEFLVQFLVLKHGASEAGLTKWTDKVRLLDSLVEHHLMEAEEASLLQEAYVAYRSAVHFSWLGGELGSYKKLASYREQVVPIWQRYLEV
jgi:glutamate-ammonia-ligase adenylyltransferase